MSGDAKEPSHNWGADDAGPAARDSEPLKEDIRSRVVRPVAPPAADLQAKPARTEPLMPSPALVPPAIEADSTPPTETGEPEPPPKPDPIARSMRAPGAATSQPSHGYTEQDFDKDDEPFDRDDAQKVGIIGGKGTGKSYLFQAMVYRTLAGQQSGALTYFLEQDGMRLFSATANPAQITQTGASRTLNRVKFIEKYQRWERLPFTSLMQQQWYRLRLLVRIGLLGRKRSAMDVEFFDGSGEGFLEQQATTPEQKRLWAKAYRNAKVMVFCLPMWAAFPSEELTEEEWEMREKLLAGFEQVVQNYTDMRQRHNEVEPVSSILALTMADDDRSSLQTLRDHWITPYIQSPQTYLKQLKKGSGVARYLANARKVSEILHDEFASVPDKRVAGIPEALELGRGRPWIIPLSAIDGARLEQIEETYLNRIDDTSRRREVRRISPTPVHVELPLLVALCERDNALM